MLDLLEFYLLTQPIQVLLILEKYLFTDFHEHGAIAKTDSSSKLTYLMLLMSDFINFFVLYINN